MLANKQATKEERIEALKFVVHVIGDLHQPLHCANRNGDKGGNGQLVFFPGRKKAVSLHVVWDTLPAAEQGEAERGGLRERAERKDH